METCRENVLGSILGL